MSVVTAVIPADVRTTVEHASADSVDHRPSQRDAETVGTNAAAAEVPGTIRRRNRHLPQPLSTQQADGGSRSTRQQVGHRRVALR